MFGECCCDSSALSVSGSHNLVGTSLIEALSSLFQSHEQVEQKVKVGQFFFKIPRKMNLKIQFFGSHNLSELLGDLLEHMLQVLGFTKW